MRSTVYVRNFESTLRLLAERGHQVHVVAAPHAQLDPTDLVGRLSRQYPGITHSAPPRRRPHSFARVGFDLRRALDYLRYLEPEYRDAPKLRRRAEEKAPPFVKALLQRRYVNTRRGRRALAAVLRTGDRAVPRDPALDAFIDEQRPDLVLVTPLVEPGSPQSEYVRSARALGVRTGLCVYSWDNLTNKGLIHEPLDVVTVWNDAMKAEAVTLHGVPADRVIVTGAPAYDHWFTWTPLSTREAFCARVGLNAQRPYLLYLCSSKFIAPDEEPFVRRWIDTIRSSSCLLRDAGVLVRPHPQNADAWKRADLSEYGNVTVWPRAGGNPVDTDSRSEYYDSIHHSAAVVGVNTSAQIESAIAGRGVYTMLAPEFRDTQEGTLHFRHLHAVNGGLVSAARDFPQHVSQLEAAVRDPLRDVERCRRFVEAFIRPHGVSEPATPRLVRALESVAARGRTRADRGPLWAPLARPLLARAAAALADEAAPAGADAKEPNVPRRDTKPAAAPSTRRSARIPPAAEAVRHVERTVDAGVYERYLQLRRHMQCLRETTPTPDDLTALERRVTTELEPLWQGTPDTIATLRQYTGAVTGVRASEYEQARAEATRRLEPELQKLVNEGDRTLWVEEPDVLGGFGLSSDCGLYNEDTLRSFRVTSLLQEAAVLKDFRAPRLRPTVWEIGGSGGFAYQFKRLCPHVTYLITGRPELLLLSATYLSTLFPGAHVRVFNAADADGFYQRWDEVDFAFAPDSVVHALQPPRLGLTLDIMALERMSARRVALHVKSAHDLGCRYFTSVCPSDAPDPMLAADVRPAIERWYWPHPLSAPAYVTKRLAVRRGRQAGPVKRTYLLAWRRLDA